MAENLFQLEIITPERIFYQGEAYMVEFTAVDGRMGVYKDHIPLTTVLSPGILNIKEAEGDKHAALHGGFVKILPDKIVFLAEAAEWPHEIDEERAKSAKTRAEGYLSDTSGSIDVARAKIALQRALIRLEVKGL